MGYLQRTPRPLNLVPLLGGVALLTALLASLWWGLGERGAKNDAEAELDMVQAQLAEQSSQSNAIAYRLSATPNGSPKASGTAFMPLRGSGVLSIVNVDPPGQDRNFQLWYFVDDSTPPIAGGTFTVDEQGFGYMLIPADVGTFTGIGISIEPLGGSASPTSPMILQGPVSESRG